MDKRKSMDKKVPSKSMDNLEEELKKELTLEGATFIEEMPVYFIDLSKIVAIKVQDTIILTTSWSTYKEVQFNPSYKGCVIIVIKSSGVYPSAYKGKVVTITEDPPKSGEWYININREIGNTAMSHRDAVEVVANLEKKGYWYVEALYHTIVHSAKPAVDIPNKPTEREGSDYVECIKSGTCKLRFGGDFDEVLERYLPTSEGLMERSTGDLVVEGRLHGRVYSDKILVWLWVHGVLAEPSLIDKSGYVTIDNLYIPI